MVLFKRKPVQFLPPAEVPNEDLEVWYIPETGEVFVSYEDYLNRMDFYKQPKFNDQITGQSGMTFFEAFKSELTGGKEVEANFPEALKGPVLRRVQFQTTSRLDNMVDQLFAEFKTDFYPGEEVTVPGDGGDRIHGLVRDKTSFGPRILPDGTSVPPMSRYLVSLKDNNSEIHVKDEDVARDRGVFTKAMLRSFIKRTTIREAWNGAPWLVKHDYAGQYHIDTRIPPHLRYDTKREERRQLQAQKRATQSLGADDSINSDGGPMRLPDLKPAYKSKGKHNVALHGSNPLAHEQKASEEPTPPPPPPPPQPKYPIEDLDLEVRESLAPRPKLQFLCKDAPFDGHTEDWRTEQIDMESVGPLLETWDTLNVYCEIFQLDSFTFDDFVETMLVASEQVPVQLFDEIHCAVLKILVDSEKDGGKVRITLPELEDEDSDEDDEDEDEEGSEEETPEPEPKPTGRATRSSLAKAEAERLAAEAAAKEEEELQAELETRHRAEELLKDYSWIDHLRSRDFTNGGWERIMVGLLHQLSKDPRKEEVCEDLLLQLVPPEVEPSQETARQAYAELDVNRRVKALQIICMLTMETKTVRGYMEECSETMTKYRKDKIDWQRQRKQATEELRQLHEQRKILLPDNMPSSPKEEGVNGDEDSKIIDADSSQISKVEDSQDEEEDPKARKKRRNRQSDKQQKRDEEKERKEEEKKKAQKAAAKLPAQSKEFIKLLKEIGKKEAFIKKCEDEVNVIENDLREADCPRTRVLGKDRFWNRYYWFERNGMPYGGLPTSSTASADYANGCIWVQGPDVLEADGYINLPQDLEDEYKSKHNMTVKERRTKEEGETTVVSAHQWGYISDPEQVDELIKWLDSRGNREMRLRKEIIQFREKIIANMEHRKAYLTESEEPQKKEETKRSSSRIRDKTPEPPNYRCLQWENTMALEELGHLHSEPPPPPRARKATKKREAQEPAAAPPSKSRKR